jgi:hypothetical protein
MATVLLTMSAESSTLMKPNSDLRLDPESDSTTLDAADLAHVQGGALQEVAPPRAEEHGARRRARRARTAGATAHAVSAGSSSSR